MRDKELKWNKQNKQVKPFAGTEKKVSKTYEN